MSLKIASWNVNSVRTRWPLVERFLSSEQPDVICLQETKVVDALFPIELFRDLGYGHAAFWGMKSYNGVAILSRRPLVEIQRHCPGGEADCRQLSAIMPSVPELKGRDLEIHSLYIPAGGDLPDAEKNPKFAYKLRFLTQLAQWSEQRRAKGCSMILAGDFNVAPLEHDVWDHKKLSRIITHTPTEIAHLSRFQQAGSWLDIGRRFVPPEQKLFTWWSYRQQGADWQTANRGRRLDHLWASSDLETAITSFSVLTEARGWEQPSDHCPILMTLEAEVCA